MYIHFKVSVVFISQNKSTALRLCPDFHYLFQVNVDNSFLHKLKVRKHFLFCAKMVSSMKNLVGADVTKCQLWHVIESIVRAECWQYFCCRHQHIHETLMQIIHSLKRETGREINAEENIQTLSADRWRRESSSDKDAFGFVFCCRFTTSNRCCFCFIVLSVHVAPFPTNHHRYADYRGRRLRTFPQSFKGSSWSMCYRACDDMIHLRLWTFKFWYFARLIFRWRW